MLSRKLLYLCILIFLSLYILPQTTQAATYYVAVNGNDNNLGTIEQPFATIEKARDAIRATGEDGATVYIREGTYYLTQPLRFDERDSGSPGAPNTYRSYNGERVVISGGKRLDSVDYPWTLHQGSIYRVNIGSLRFNSLFVDDNRAIRAREPDVGTYTIASDTAPANDSLSFNFTIPNIDGSWHDLTNVEIVSQREYIQYRQKIASVESNLVTVASAANHGFRWPSYADISHKTYYVENVFEGLDTPGEWYLDNDSNTLYYWPINGKNPNTSTIIVGNLGAETVSNVRDGLLLNVVGASENSRVEYLDFSGLTFAHTDWHLTSSYMGWAGAQFLEICNPPSYNTGVNPAIQYFYAANCSFSDNVVTHQGGNGMVLFAKYMILNHNTFADIGGNAIVVGSDDYSWRSITGITEHITITNNTIHDFGSVFQEGSGILVQIAPNNTISHNLIYNGSYHGIFLGWLLYDRSYTNSTDNVVSYNEIYNVATGGLNDAGAIYTMGYQNRSIIEKNKIHDVGVNGIYCDESSSGVTVRNNWVYRAMTGLLLHSTNGNAIDNNVFVDSTWSSLVFAGGSNNTLTHNIVYSNATRRFYTNFGLNVGASNYNDIYSASGWTPGYGFTDWKTLTGLDINSLDTNPLFVNYANDNFSLQPNSPAFDSGFQQIDMSSVGPGTIIYGDISGNSSLDSSDASMAAQYSLGLITLTSNQITLGDVSGDTKITAYDAALILLKITGIISKFPIE